MDAAGSQVVEALPNMGGNYLAVEGLQFYNN
jgi:hypothetical protein